MLSKAQFKFVNSLKDKKVRQEHSLFVAEGEKVVDELLNSDYEVHEIYALADWVSKNKTRIQNLNVFEVNDSDLERLTYLSKAQKVVALAKQKQPTLKTKDIFSQLSLVLDNINDPGNLGTIIRIADWFNIRNIVCSTRSVELYNPKVIQSTMGSFTRVNVYYTDLEKLLVDAKKEDLPIYGAQLNGKNIYESDLVSPGLIVMGSESHGISKEIQKLINRPITIPRFSEEGAESLNVAVATAIICSEFRRNFF